MDILAHVNKMMSAKTVPPQLNQFPCLSASASTTTSATSSPPPRASTLGRTWQGRGWNLRLHRTKVHLKRSWWNQAGSSFQEAPTREATARFSSAATPKFRGVFVVEKVSQEDAAFILAWLSDPSSSKRVKREKIQVPKCIRLIQDKTRQDQLEAGSLHR